MAGFEISFGISFPNCWSYDLCDQRWLPALMKVYQRLFPVFHHWSAAKQSPQCLHDPSIIWLRSHVSGYSSVPTKCNTTCQNQNICQCVALAFQWTLRLTNVYWVAAPGTAWGIVWTPKHQVPSSWAVHWTILYKPQNRKEPAHPLHYVLGPWSLFSCPRRPQTLRSKGINPSL